MDQHDFFGGSFLYGGKKWGKTYFPVLFEPDFYLLGEKKCRLGKKSQKWGEKRPYFLTKTMACVTLLVALPFTLKSILMQKKNYGNSNI
jgi:hypothetical protein